MSERDLNAGTSAAGLICGHHRDVAAELVDSLAFSSGSVLPPFGLPPPDDAHQPVPVQRAPTSERQRTAPDECRLVVPAQLRQSRTCACCLCICNPRAGFSCSLFLRPLPLSRSLPLSSFPPLLISHHFRLPLSLSFPLFLSLFYPSVSMCFAITSVFFYYSFTGPSMGRILAIFVQNREEMHVTREESGEFYIHRRFFYPFFAFYVFLL